MTSILTDLWYGNLEPCNERSKRLEEMKQLLKLMNRHSEDLNRDLTSNQKEILEKFLECNRELEAIECTDAFMKGFSLAVKLLGEALYAE